MKIHTMRPLRSGQESLSRLERILQAFNNIPSVVAERSTSIQHHWGRVFYHLSQIQSQSKDKLKYLNEAIGKLGTATVLIDRDRSRENPRNIFNTLGAVRTELSNFYRDNGEIIKAERLWAEAANAFDRALGYGADNYVTLSAFASRLIDHGTNVNSTTGPIASISPFHNQTDWVAMLPRQYFTVHYKS